MAAWRSGSVVGLDQRGYPTLSPVTAVSTGMGDRVRVRLPSPEGGILFRYVTNHPGRLLPSVER